MRNYGSAINPTLRPWRWGTGLLAIGLLGGCSGTKHLGANEYLIASSPTFKGTEQLSSSDLEDNVRTKANRRFMGPKLYLSLHNLGTTLGPDTTPPVSLFQRVANRLDKSGNLRLGAQAYLHELGEAPTVLDTALLAEDCQNLESVYFANGFFTTRARYHVRPKFWNPKKVGVAFHLNEGPAYHYRDIRLEVEDSAVKALILAQQAYTLLRPGDRYNEDVLGSERDRIAALLQNHGYYTINTKRISYVIDTTITEKAQEDTAQMQQLLQKFFPRRKPSVNKIRFIDLEIHLPKPQKVWEIGEILVKVRQDANDTLLEFRGSQLTPEERAYYRIPERRFSTDAKIVFRTTPRILRLLNLNTVIEQFTFRTGDQYRYEKVVALQRRLRELGIFQSVFVRFKENPASGRLDLEVDLALVDRYSFSVGFETVQSENVRLNANLPGIGANLAIVKRNAFKRAEVLQVRPEGRLSFYRPDAEQSLQLYYQLGAQVSLTYPRLLLLSAFTRNWKNFYTPTTTVTARTTFERPVEYSRVTFGADFTYQWFHTFGQPSWRSAFVPINISIINSELTPSFEQALFEEDANGDSTLYEFILRDFEDRFSSKIGYTLFYSDNYSRDKTRLTSFFSVGVEFGGTIPFLVDVVGKAAGFGDGATRDGRIQNGEQYGQFAKLRLEGRLHKPIGERLAVVGRMILGAAQGFVQQPPLILFENRFYVGGTNSIRGWQSSTLGPGTMPISQNQVVAFGGDLKFEANAEIRWNFFSFLQLAAFVDVGNVWFTKRSGFEDPRGWLTKENLHLGAAAGLGLRLDFDLVVARLDVAQQIYAPDIQRFTFSSPPGPEGNPVNRLQFNLAIGYPF